METIVYKAWMSFIIVSGILREQATVLAGLELENCPDYVGHDSTLDCTCQYTDSQGSVQTTAEVQWVHQDTGTTVAHGWGSAILSLNYTQEDDCVQGWSYHSPSDTCLKYVEQDVTWDEARAYCQTFSGDLVRIPDSSTQTFISDLLPVSRSKDAFIGLADRHVFFWLEDRTTPTFTAYLSGQPNNWSNQEDCIIVTQKALVTGWNDLTCDANIRYICESPSDDDECDVGGALYNSVTGTCFSLVMDKTATWTNARLDCADSYNGDLARVTDSLTQKYIARAVEMFGYSFYIGLHSPREFYWLDDVDTMGSYHFWQGGSPEDSTLKDCGIILPDNTWGVSDCSTNNYFVCQMGTVPIGMPDQNFTCTTETNSITSSVEYTARTAYGPTSVTAGFLSPNVTSDIYIHCDVDTASFNPGVNVTLDGLPEGTIFYDSVTTVTTNESSSAIQRFIFRFQPAEEGEYNATCVAVNDVISDYLVESLMMFTVFTGNTSSSESSDPLNATATTTISFHTNSNSPSATTSPMLTTTANNNIPTTITTMNTNITTFTTSIFTTSSPITNHESTGIATTSTNVTDITDIVITTTTNTNTTTNANIITKTNTNTTTNADTTTTTNTNTTTNANTTTATNTNTTTNANITTATNTNTTTNANITTTTNAIPSTTFRAITTNPTTATTNSQLTNTHSENSTHHQHPTTLPKHTTTHHNSSTSNLQSHTGPTTHRLCPCQCSNHSNHHYHNLTKHQIDQLTSSIQKELIVKTDTLSSNVRKKSSAKDKRASAKVSGVFGLVFISVIFGSILFLDIISSCGSRSQSRLVGEISIQRNSIQTAISIEDDEESSVDPES